MDDTRATSQPADRAGPGPDSGRPASDPDSALRALSLLRDPHRAALYHYVMNAEGEVNREDAARAVGLKHGAAGFHLDKLAEAGLLRVTFRRLGERTGPGAGRPAKLYRRTDEEVSASVPPRDYQAAALLLAETVEQAGADEALFAAARRAGTEAGRTTRAAGGAGRELLRETLARRGYEPADDGAAVCLRNCPFHALTQDHQKVRLRPMVCGMNLALLEGLLDGLGLAEAWSARMDSVPERCCVTLQPALVSKTARN